MPRGQTLTAGDQGEMVARAQRLAEIAQQQARAGEVEQAIRGYENAVTGMKDALRYMHELGRRQKLQSWIRDCEANLDALRAQPLGRPPPGRGAEPPAATTHWPGDDADLCEMCYERPKTPGHEYCGKSCAKQTPLNKRVVALWNHTHGPVEVAGIGGPEATLTDNKNRNFITNQGEVFTFKSGGEVVGQWRVTKHSIQHVFAEIDPTTRQATVRGMVCDAVEGEPAFEKCRTAPTRAAVEKIRSRGGLPTIEQVAPSLGVKGFRPPERQRAIDDRRRAGAPTAPAEPATRAEAPSPIPEPRAGATMTRSDSGCTFRSLGVPDIICAVLKSTGKTWPKYAQRRVIELLYRSGNPDASRFRLLIDSETGMEGQYSNHAGGYEDAAALTLICPFLDAYGVPVKSRCGPARAICVVSNASTNSEASMRPALERFVEPLHSGGRTNAGLNFQQLGPHDRQVTGDVVLADASTIVRMITEGHVDARAVRTLVMRDADLDCATYDRNGRKLFAALKAAGAKPRVLFCARKPRDRRHYDQIKRFATTHASPCDEWSALQQARSEQFARSAPQAGLVDRKREKVGRLQQLLGASSARTRGSAQDAEDEIVELFDQLQQIHGEMERQGHPEAAALKEDLENLGDQFAADLLDDFGDDADGSSMHAGGGGGALEEVSTGSSLPAGDPPLDTLPAYNPAATPSVAQMSAGTPGATWESLGGFWFAGRLAGAPPVHSEECSLATAKARCGFGNVSSKVTPIQDVVAFTFQDQLHAGKGTAGPQPLGAVECKFYGAGVQAQPDPNWYSYICPGQHVPGAVKPSSDAGTGASTGASNGASTGGARERRITADNDRSAGGSDHRRAGGSNGRRAGESVQPNMCRHCRVKPVFVEGTGYTQKVHKFCGRSCAESAKQSTVAPAAGAQPAGQRRTVPFDQRSRWDRLPGVIKFYEKFEDFYEFTNFWECDQLLIDGKQWPTTEHYFQAQKFVAWPTLVEQCRTQPTPRECFEMVRNPAYKPYVRDDWHRGHPSVKDKVMYNAVMHKFTQDQTLKRLLLSTAFDGQRRMIIEHTKNDDYWGDGGAHRWHVGDSGNKLGQLLVRIRDEIHCNTLQGGGHGYPLPLVQPAALGPPPAPGVAGAGVAAGGGRMCNWCHQKPARTGHDYCGRTCGTAASQAGLTTQHSRGGGRGVGGGAVAPPGRHGQHQPQPHQPQQHQPHQVTCPAGVVPGQQLEVVLGTGERRTVIVPHGISPGMGFLVQ